MTPILVPAVLCLDETASLMRMASRAVRPPHQLIALSHCTVSLHRGSSCFHALPVSQTLSKSTRLRFMRIALRNSFSQNPSVRPSMGLDVAHTLSM